MQKIRKLSIKLFRSGKKNAAFMGLRWLAEGEFRELFSYWMMRLIDLPTNDSPVASEAWSTLVVPVFGISVWQRR